jgi:hypothetical protein
MTHSSSKEVTPGDILSELFRVRISRFSTSQDSLPSPASKALYLD